MGYGKKMGKDMPKKGMMKGGVAKKAKGYSSGGMAQKKATKSTMCKAGASYKG
jgi:hypothetical protein